MLLLITKRGEDTSQHDLKHILIDHRIILSSQQAKKLNLSCR